MFAAHAAYLLYPEGTRRANAADADEVRVTTECAV